MGFSSPGAGATSSSKLPDIGAGKQSQAICTSSVCSPVKGYQYFKINPHVRLHMFTYLFFTELCGHRLETLQIVCSCQAEPFLHSFSSLSVGAVS